MNRPLCIAALLFASACAHAGHFSFSPTRLIVDNRETSAEVLIMYQPSEDIRYAQVDANIALERLGWSDVEVVPAGAPYYNTFCYLYPGGVRASLQSQPGFALPMSASIPLCRLRVRPHAHTPSGSTPISAGNYYEIGGAGAFPTTPTVGGSVRVGVQ